jgi:predicted AAA+ superfamily ATPase
MTTTIGSELNQLLIYRNILQDSIFQQLQNALTTNKDYSQMRYDLSCQLINHAEQLGLTGNILKSYLIYLVLQDKNIFSVTAEKYGDKIGASLAKAVLHDIAILRTFLASNLDALYESSIISNYSPTHSGPTGYVTLLQECFVNLENPYTANQVLSKLIEHYVQHGYGEIANYAAFRWNHETGLTGIRWYDQIRLEDIIGYEHQKAVLVSNTEAFLAHRPANNVLLAGDRGTGKSSSVKALVNRYFAKGLRLVEVSKHELQHLNDIMNTLRGRGKKFILFLDDLSFEEFEVEYKYLKSIMEGGLEAKPDNVLIYATSNRRHLIRETWRDNEEEIHTSDTVNEKISLSDRFGITLTYSSPNQDDYLKIIEGLAKRNNLPLSPAELKADAIKWEMLHSGRSGRSAQQFITHLLGNMDGDGKNQSETNN